MSVRVVNHRGITNLSISDGKSGHALKALDLEFESTTGAIQNWKSHSSTLESEDS